MSSEQIAQYHEDGYVIVPGFFDPEEVEPVRIACEEEPSQSLGLCFCSLERQIGRKLKMRSASSKSA
ncbi:MAG TPA: hypothetical protein DDW76_32435 [Cyanobacteria bacterium UBA11369]|nr:hypothetical protein [Cyanobacteria bacterium UBA11371]HBE35383.1 hypothetical protein [Cyanobacteria bacterium UBA11368]HBE53340.1 hypothetical protein [Cyanobacteria bacterium UBA11369]